MTVWCVLSSLTADPPQIHTEWHLTHVRPQQAHQDPTRALPELQRPVRPGHHLRGARVRPGAGGWGHVWTHVESRQRPELLNNPCVSFRPELARAGDLSAGARHQRGHSGQPRGGHAGSLPHLWAVPVCEYSRSHLTVHSQSHPSCFKEQTSALSAVVRWGERPLNACASLT